MGSQHEPHVSQQQHQHEQRQLQHKQQKQLQQEQRQRIQQQQHLLAMQQQNRSRRSSLNVVPGHSPPLSMLAPGTGGAPRFSPVMRHTLNGVGNHNTTSGVGGGPLSASPRK